MDPSDDLTSALQSLDRLLERAVSAALAAADAVPVEDRFRGLYVGSEEVQQMLSRAPGRLPAWRAGLEQPSALDAAGDAHSLRWLGAAFDLEPFDLATLLIALAADLDLKYERVYAYLQDDVTRRRPTVDLVLNLLCGSAAEKRQQLARFAPSAPLVRHGLVSLIVDGQSPHAGLLAHAVKVDEQIVTRTTGGSSLDSRLISFCRLAQPSEPVAALPLDPQVRRSLQALLAPSPNGARAPRVYLRDRDAVVARRIAEGLAADQHRALLHVDCRAMPLADADRLPQLAFREAWFRDALVHLDRLDALRSDERAGALRAWLRAAADGRCATVLSGRRPWVASECDDEWSGAGVFEIQLGIPAHRERRLWWKRSLAEHGIAVEAAAVDTLAGRFHLTASQIAGAAASISSQAVCGHASLEGDAARPHAAAVPTLDDVFAMARAQCTMDVGPAARKITPAYTWADIILPPPALQQLRELCARVTHRHVVLGEWGFDRKLSIGRGVTALFAGATGTGKTMAAEIVAHELGLDLYKIDLAGIVSKYIGETEKNLDRVFTAAENANAILFFDEADALFGKRSEVRDSHDRYANIEISYLLQKMDQYDGVAILATNLRENMDDAFVRRLQFVIEFPFPDEAHRPTLWTALFPLETPRASDLDFAFLARQFRLSGGHIRNIVLGASYLAAGNGGRVEMPHLIRATWRECEKLGRAVTPEDFGRYAESLP